MSTLGSSILLLIALGVPIVLANLGLRHRWAGVIASVWIGLLAAGTFLLGVSVLLLLGLSRSLRYALNPQVPLGVFLVAALLLILLVPLALLVAFWARARRRLTARLPLDPDNPVHTAAVTLLILSFVTALLQQVLLTALPAFAEQVFAAARYGSLEILIGELPFLVIGFLGVGIFVRRDFGQSLQRLGLVRPSWGQVALGLAAAGALFLASSGLERLGAWLTPELSRQLMQNSENLFGHLTDPVSALVVGVSAGVCEEVLFRGALQPRLGIAATAVLFGVVHLNYGVSFSLLSVVLAAVVLGLLRRYANTSTSIVAHATLDIVALGLSGWLVYPLMIAMTVVMGGAAGLALRREGGRPSGTAPSSAPAQAR